MDIDQAKTVVDTLRAISAAEASNSNQRKHLLRSNGWNTSYDTAIGKRMWTKVSEGQTILSDEATALEYLKREAYNTLPHTSHEQRNS